MKKGMICRLLTLVLLIGSLVVPMYTPVAKPVYNITGVSEKAEAASLLTVKQAKKKLIKWLRKHDQMGDVVEYNSREGKKYLFHVYDDMGSHTATRGWYYVHRKTGKITSMF